MIVVADTGPINYLILSNHVHLLWELYGGVLIPAAVSRELDHSRTPSVVRSWISALPSWASIRQPKCAQEIPELGAGEREAILVALEEKADWLLMDETRGRKIAIEAGIAVKGTLGVLEEAANRQLVHLPGAIADLKATGIFLNEKVIQQVLERHRIGKPS